MRTEQRTSGTDRWRPASRRDALTAQQSPGHKIHRRRPAGARRRQPEAAAQRGPRRRRSGAAICRRAIDLSGVWQGGGPVGDIAQGARRRARRIPLLPEAEDHGRRQSKDDPEANCLPTGVPRIAPYPWRMLQTPTHIVHAVRRQHPQLPADFHGRPQAPGGSDPTWYGHSVGHWEGDTLVVDTVGFNDKFWFDFRGHPHTEKLHTIERYTRTDLGTLVIETTIDDPGAYSKPFTIKFTARLRPGEELMEYICQENEQDAKHIKGPAGLP